MSDWKFLKEAKKRKKFKEICEEHELNRNFTKTLLELYFSGHTKTEIAQRLGIHKSTIEAYLRVFRGMEEKTFDFLCDYTLNI